MKKDKRKKSEARRRGSILQHGSSESASQHSGFSSQQQPDSEFTSQKQSGSRPGLIPQHLVSQAFRAPEISQSARGRQCHNTSTKPSSGPKKTGPLTQPGPHPLCSCSACPCSSTCWRRLGLCHSRIFDVLLPRVWPTMPGRGFPNLLTFYRKPTRKHSIHRNSRAPSSRDCDSSSGGTGSSLLHH
ncbi:spermatogenesis associated 3 [Rhinolophus ferrumequinum]|uniref:Spermatogenesis associated 3 n=1 Tax=Rhinolophus ferrumequinum TaxID=59479 RepID=A0A7J7YK33_RHIFE|nr:spermatogenesis associated 3 [Rhinolophus ferrumequinum]